MGYSHAITCTCDCCGADVGAFDANLVRYYCDSECLIAHETELLLASQEAPTKGH